MSVWDNLSKIITFQPPQRKPFELLGTEAAPGKNQGGSQPGQSAAGKSAQKQAGQQEREEQPKKFIKPRRAIPISVWYRCTQDKRSCPGDHLGQAGQGGSREKKGDNKEKPAQAEGVTQDRDRNKDQGKNKICNSDHDRAGVGVQNGINNDHDEGKGVARSECGNIDIGELGRVSANLKKNLKCLKKTFHVPTNKDVIFREFTIGADPPVAAAVIYIDGMTDRILQNLSILEPLMLLAGLNVDRGETLLDTVIKRLLPGNQVDATDELRDVVDGVLMGSTAVLIDYCPKAIIVETKGWEHRQVGRPTNEIVIRGPQEGFTETLRVNTALIRKSLHSPNLVTEFFKIGRVNRLDCAVMYIAGLTNPQLLAEVKRRIQSVTADFISDSSVLEQFIEDSHFILVPQTLATERPDRVIAGLVEGQVAVLVDGNPYALLMPANFFAVFQNPEDAYVRWPFGSLLRLIRLFGLFLATFLPGLYIAVISHHHEMIPTDLLLAISASRENVPFPSIVEVLIMEVSFELIREASIRVPGPIGPTLGIVGALILGQAAVAANIVSPILIIIVAVTAIGSFAVSSYSLSLTARFLRFVNILLGAFLGIYGLMLGVFVYLNILAGTKSFGVPYLVPIAPQAKTGPDLLYRGPAWQQEQRPEYLQPGQPKRQPDISRGWLKKGGGRR